MSDKLEEKLTNIEEKLGGTEEVPADSQDKLGWHLDYIESLIGGSGGDVQLKTLNNEELKGEGNIEIPVVTANPETTGEETALNSLQVGDNKFVLGGAGGGHCYILWYNRGSGWPVYFVYYFSDADLTTVKDVYDDLAAKGYTSASTLLPVIGYYQTDYSGTHGSSSTVPSTVTQVYPRAIWATANTIYVRCHTIKTTYNTSDRTITGVEEQFATDNYTSISVSQYFDLIKLY